MTLAKATARDVEELPASAPRRWRALLTRSLLGACLVCLPGCLDYGILELDLELPETWTVEPMYAVIEASSTDVIDFETNEGWFAPDVASTELLASVSRRQVSVVATGPAMFRPLGLRVRFCSSPRCAAGPVPEARYTVDRAFYRGERTRLPIVITRDIAESREPNAIPICQVRGCVPVRPEDHCTPGGRHVCDL